MMANRLRVEAKHRFVLFWDGYKPLTLFMYIYLYMCIFWRGIQLNAPAAYGYEFQSHGAIEMLAQLQEKFVSERTDMDKQFKKKLAKEKPQS